MDSLFKAQDKTKKKCKGECGEYKDLSEFATNTGSNTPKPLCRICANEERRPKRNTADQNKRHNDDVYRRKDNIKRRVRGEITALSQGKKKKSSAFIEDLWGCTWLEYKPYIENLWAKGMTWENRGNIVWQIDHIIALVHFDFENDEELHKALHYTNTQPLWVSDHKKKGIK